MYKIKLKCKLYANLDCDPFLSYISVPPHYDDVEDEQQVNKNKLFYFSKFLSKSNISLHKSDKGLVAGGQQTSVNYENWFDLKAFTYLLIKIFVFKLI